MTSSFISQASSLPPSRPLLGVAGFGTRGIKRQESDGGTPSNTKWCKTNKGVKGRRRVSTKVGKRVKAKGRTADSKAARELVPKRTDHSGQDPSDQQQDQEDFLRKFRYARNDLKARPGTRERAFSGN